MARRITMRPRFEIPLKKADGQCLERLQKLLEEDEA